MKHKLRQIRDRLLEFAASKRIPRPVRWIIDALSRNVGLKLFSLLLAILLWNYVISTNTSITRTKTLHNLTGYVSGQTALNNYGLALLEVPYDALSSLNVVVEAPQADYSRVSNENVQVSLDLSSIRSAGTQEVPFRATSSYGRVVSIQPESLTLTFETLDSRTIAVNPVIAGASEDYWYNVSRTNPTMLTVSGASSVVQSITSAQVIVDVTGLTASTVTSLPYVLTDSSGEAVSQTMLNRSTSSISINLDVYPCGVIPVSTDPAAVTTGQPAEGFVVQSVSIQPEAVVVAAERELLDSLDELMIEPVSVEGASQSFSARASLSQLPDFKNVSTEQVYVNVAIGEEIVSASLSDIGLSLDNLAENLTATYEPLSATVTGPRSQVAQLMEEGLDARLNLDGLEAGYYLLTPEYDAGLYPDIDILFEAVSLTLTDTGASE